MIITIKLGNVITSKLVDHKTVDKPPWLPPVYKICSNISPNTAVLGYDLYKILIRIQEKYLIERIGEYIEETKNNVPYSVYSLSRRT
jgi:hypothetical protein